MKGKKGRKKKVSREERKESEGKRRGRGGGRAGGGTRGGHVMIKPCTNFIHKSVEGEKSLKKQIFL